MRLCSTKIYLEVGIRFNISHKVSNLIVEHLTDGVMKPSGLSKKDPNVFLDLQVTTKESYSELSVFKPSGIEDGFLRWQLRMPYEKINDSKDYLETYIKFFFLGATEVFAEFGISEDSIMTVREKVENEVIGNKEYEYVEGYVSKVDTSKYDF